MTWLGGLLNRETIMRRVKMIARGLPVIRSFDTHLLEGLQRASFHPTDGVIGCDNIRWSRKALTSDTEKNLSCDSELVFGALRFC